MRNNMLKLKNVMYLLVVVTMGIDAFAGRYWSIGLETLICLSTFGVEFGVYLIEKDKQGELDPENIKAMTALYQEYRRLRKDKHYK